MVDISLKDLPLFGRDISSSVKSALKRITVSAEVSESMVTDYQNSFKKPNLMRFFRKSPSYINADLFQEAMEFLKGEQYWPKDEAKAHLFAEFPNNQRIPDNR